MARQSRVPTLLLTRPAAQSQRFARQVAGVLGEIPLVVSPLMETVFHAPPLPDRPFQAVIFTSETGVEAAHRWGAKLPDLAYCVGQQTAEAAAKAGFRPRSADGNAQDLAALIKGAGQAGPLLHLRGADSAGDLAETLTNGGIETESLILYSQEPRPLSRAALDLAATETAVILPVFSPRSARLLVAALPQDRRCSLWIAAISPAAAAAAAPLNPVHLNIAARPDGENMLHAVAALLALALKA